MKLTLLLVVALAAFVAAAPKKSETQFRNLFRKAVPGAKPQHGRIINGEIAEPHSIPYQAFLEVSGIFGGWYCGGSLIKENVILTAGHCGYEGLTADITLGAQSPLKNEPDQVRVSSTNIIVHPGFDMDEILNDIALIILSQAVTLNDNVQTVPLPTSNPTYVGQVATVSGWGLTDGFGSSLSDQLRFTQNPVISNAACNAIFGIVKDYQVCISGDGGRSSCNGDSGGPLTIGGVQIGVVSYGVQYCQQGYPSAFTRTGAFLHWIEENSS